MSYQSVTTQYSVIATKRLPNGKVIRTKAGVAQRFEDGNIHLVLNVLPLTPDLWLEVDEKGLETYPDPKE